MRKTGWIAALLTLVLALMLGAAAEAEEARVITRECAFKSSTTKFKRTQMMDDKFTNYWYTAKGKHNFFQLTAPAGDPIHGLYLCFKSMPDAYEVQVRQGGEWVTRYTGDTNYYHIYYDFPEGVETLRVYLPTNTSQVLGFNMIYAFSAGDTPDWVQRWEPPLEHADILFLAAHPDDDLIFFGGGIPTYAGERDLQVEVAYMSPSNTTRRSELLNALWALGVRHYPIIGPFADSYQKTVERQWEVLGGKDAVYSWVTEVFRRCRPDVVVTQDADGEYGHPMHKIVAQAARECVALAASEDRYPESLSAFGAWQVKKLYLHLWPENQSRFDWETPLEAFGGKTGIELADEAYTTYHYSQRASGMSVRETGSKYDNHLFGLCFTTVGPDVVGGDFMENIGGAALPVLEDSGAEDTPDGLTEEAPADGEPAAAPEEDGGEPEEAPAQTASAVPEGPWVETDPELAEILPPLNSRGYLDEGEFVWSSEERGLYIYVSRTLRLIIRRTYEVPDKKHPFYCFTADIYCDVAAGELPHAVFANAENQQNARRFIKVIAEENKLVFATSTDYYTYRSGKKKPRPGVGIIVRGGEIFFDEPRKNPPSMPNYATLAFYRDGHVESLLSTERGAQEYIDGGAYDVYCFGPCLIRDGEFTDYVLNANKSYNPRYAIGMVEPGHYVAVLCEGRLKRSKGVQMPYLAQLLKDRGCQIAVNMDGGQTAVMCFMGRQLNEVVTTDPNGRKQAECLGVGVSDQVGAYEIQP